MFQLEFEKQSKMHPHTPRRNNIRAAGMQLDGDDPEEQEKLAALLDVVRSITGDRIPQLEKVTRARLMLSYPWSPDEEV